LPDYFNSRGYPLRRARKEKELDRIRDHIKNKIFPKYFSTGTSDTLPEPSRPKTEQDEAYLSNIYDLSYDLKWRWDVPAPDKKKLREAGKEVKNVLKYLVGVDADVMTVGGLDPEQQRTLQKAFNKEGGQGKMDIMGFEREIEQYFDSLGFKPPEDDERRWGVEESITFDRWSRIIK
jgi:hypothetical protein